MTKEHLKFDDDYCIEIIHVVGVPSVFLSSLAGLTFTLDTFYSIVCVQKGIIAFHYGSLRTVIAYFESCLVSDA